VRFEFEDLIQLAISAPTRALGTLVLAMTCVVAAAGHASARTAPFSGTPVDGGGNGSVNPTVVTWNIDSVESGKGTEENARATMDYITDMSPLPQIIVLQEALQSQFYTYIDQLQNTTGLTWSGVFGTHCGPGSWTGDSCAWDQDEGVAILTSLPIVDGSSTYLAFPDDWHSARGAVRAAVDVGGTVVQVFGAHLSNTVSARYGMMFELIAYAQQFPAPQLVGGDFNADPDQIDAPGAMGDAFLDVWSVVGSGPGYTADTPDPWLHLDYLFTDYSGQIQPAWSVVVTTPGEFSDHFPVLAAFVMY
jgi:endonuclease/exonuclease/phosphatase family metal-dependent hydrolase